MGLQVIGAGFGRTGTYSLKLALETLGLGPCHHMYEVRANPNQLGPWQAATRGETVDWVRMFQGYTSQVDWPGAHYWRQLVTQFPQAKVVLTVRDPQAWYESLRQTILRSFAETRQRDPDPHSRAVSDLAHEITFVQTFGGRMHDPDHAMAVYRKHIHDVQTTVPPDHLLTYDVAEGWAPLCAFLGQPVPSAPFPATNSTDEFLARKNLAR